MNSPATVRFNDPPVTGYNSMDVDESTVSRMSTDQLYFGPADDPESCSVSSNGPEVFSPISDHSRPAQCDQPGLPVHPDLYIGPEDDLMAGMHDQSLPAQPDMLGLAIHPDLYLRPDEDIMTEIPDPSPPGPTYHPDVPIHPDLYLGPDEDLMPEFLAPKSNPNPTLKVSIIPEIPLAPTTRVFDVTDEEDKFFDYKSLLAQPDQPGFPIHPDMYLGPEDDLIDCEVKQECADSDSEVSGAPVVSRASIAKSPEHDLPHPDVTYEELLAMVRDLRPFESYNHTGIQSIQDGVQDYKQRHGHIPNPSIQQLLEAERPFRTAWAKTSDKLRRADEDLQKLQRAECLTSEMLKVLDSLILRFEDQIQM
ncbi:uncharacterized protein EDB93DRAFT_1246112 [Suillus bovinus]|uniref:uncharacterized protein n=1 Tax=Suillus bovinus TaxID=48563 RepID=UPI001B866523|nr:uncharacterized protein EDB93DRAFT_1246112 [Suillus bovinus]KAG2158261.1 hypothetical protein EDB93DRAFT_1246112 [Suillus bovinus]